MQNFGNVPSWVEKYKKSKSISSHEENNTDPGNQMYSKLSGEEKSQILKVNKTCHII